MSDLLKKIWHGIKTGMMYASGVAVFLAALALLGLAWPAVYGPLVTVTPVPA